MMWFNEETVKKIIHDAECTGMADYPKNYPHIEIPDKHGRLVDGDKLLADHNPNENWDYMVLECIIRNAPTVLEAST